MIKLSLGTNHITVQGRLKGITLATMEPHTLLYVSDETPTMTVITPYLYDVLTTIAFTEGTCMIKCASHDITLTLFDGLIVARGDISGIVSSGVFASYQVLVSPSCVNIEAEHGILYKFITKLSSTYYIEGEDE